MIWLRSRERSAALKREKYRCERCHVKQSKAKGREVKIEVHHRDGTDRAGIVDIIVERMLQTPDKFEVLCVPCHDKEHGKTKK